MGEEANSDFVPLAWRWGPLTMQGLRSNSALFWATEKAGVRQPLLIFSLCLRRGPWKKQDLCTKSALLWTHESAGVC